jgi:Tfp pilus assembly protein PilX
MKKKPISRKTEPKGIVMLLSLLVLSAITAVAIGGAAIVIKNLRASSNIDRSMMAYYAAETGIEAGLSRVKASRAGGTESLEDLISEIKDMDGTTLGNARWSLDDSATNEEYTLTNLRKNETVVLDLYDPTNLLDGAGFRSFFVEALDADPTEDPAWLEVSYFPWEATSSGMFWDDAKVTKRLRSVNETKPTMPAGFGDLIASYNYRIRIKALYDDVKNLKVIGYTNESPYENQETVCNPISVCEKAIPNRILLKSTASLGPNLVALSASVPWQVPTSALFDYVLFSEGAIDKRT